MGFSKLYGHSTSGTEYCAGFVDKHGQWNNGFYCPKWGGPDIQYCCGPDQHKYCCPKTESGPKPIQEGPHNTHISLVIGLSVGSFVLVLAALMLSCYFCRCCWGYKRRKRLQGLMGASFPASSAASAHMSRGASGRPEYSVSYSVCPHGTLLHEFMMPGPRYPSEDPPPYPGGPAIPLEEKQPFRDLEVHPGEDTPARRPRLSGCHDDDGHSDEKSSQETLPRKPWLDQPDPGTVSSEECLNEGATAKCIRADIPDSYCSDTWPMSKSRIHHQLHHKSRCCAEDEFGLDTATTTTTTAAATLSSLSSSSLTG